MAKEAVARTDAMLSQSQLAMLRKEALVVIGFNISSSPRLIDVLLSLDVHVVQKVMWAGLFQTTARKQID